MAGVGFELKKLFRRKGFAALVQAYTYTGMVTTGPMLLGVLLLLGIMVLAQWAGLSGHDQELLVCMITYALLASLLVTSFFSMVATRYLADMLYEERQEAVLPSLEGTCTILLSAGGTVYGLFLCVAGISFSLMVLNFLLFGELVVVWVQMNYLTAVKHYKGILGGFVCAVAGAFLSGGCFVYLAGPSVEGLLSGVCVGYGIMLCVDMVQLYGFFPKGAGSRFTFLQWFDEYRELAFVGLFVNLGLFTHLVIAWAGPAGVRVQGLFYGAPQHDVPALFAFMSILITTINFVVSVEVNFYPKYRNYYDLFNEKGSIRDIEQAEKDMMTVLEYELSYTGRKQFYMTALMLSVGVLVLSRLPLGFNDLMAGYFRILCVGYGIYAVGNIMMLMLLYFTDYKGAKRAAAWFAAVTTAGSLLSLLLPARYYGFAFVAGSMAYYLVSQQRLSRFTEKLPYHILSSQPITVEKRYGSFSRIGERLDKRGTQQNGQ